MTTVPTMFTFVCIAGPNEGSKCTLSSAQESRDIAFCPVCKKNTYWSDGERTDGERTDGAGRVCTSHWARLIYNTLTKADLKDSEPSSFTRL